MKKSYYLKYPLLVLGCCAAVLTGCVGYVGDGGPDVVDVGVGGPVFVGGYDRGHHFDHAASHRGFESRRVAGHVSAPHGPVGHRR